MVAFKHHIIYIKNYQELIYDHFDSAWTDSKSIFCLKEIAINVTHLHKKGTKSLGINQLYWLLHFVIKVLPFRTDFSDFLWEFQSTLIFVLAGVAIRRLAR